MLPRFGLCARRSDLNASILTIALSSYARKRSRAIASSISTRSRPLLMGVSRSKTRRVGCTLKRRDRSALRLSSPNELGCKSTYTILPSWSRSTAPSGGWAGASGGSPRRDRSRSPRAARDGRFDLAGPSCCHLRMKALDHFRSDQAFTRKHVMHLLFASSPPSPPLLSPCRTTCTKQYTLRSHTRESLKVFPHTTHSLDVYCSHRQHVLHLAMCTQHKSRKRSVYTIRMPHKLCHSPRPLKDHCQRHNSQPPSRHESLARPTSSPARRRCRDAVAVWLRLHPQIRRFTCIPSAIACHPLW